MNLSSMMTRPCVITTPGGPVLDGDGEPGLDGYGEPVLDDDVVTTLPDDNPEGLGAYLEQTSTSEITVGQQTSPGVSWAALPPATPVKDTSSLHFTDTDEKFQVDGRPALRHNPWEGRVEFIRVELKSNTA